MKIKDRKKNSFYFNVGSTARLGLRTISEHLIAKPFSLIVKLEDCKGKGCIYEIVNKLTSKTCETHIILPKIDEKADYYYVRIVMEDNQYKLLDYSVINIESR